MKRKVDALASAVTSELMMETNSELGMPPTHEEIAQVAFSLYESRGRQDGQQLEDWLRAEQELVRHYA